ncbi:hypothetical protein ACHAWF_010774 [Thalassiosira exigua]
MQLLDQLRRVLKRMTKSESEDEEGSRRENADENEGSLDENSDEKEKDYGVYELTLPSEWKEITGRARGQTINPTPFGGENEEFTVNIMAEELEKLKVSIGDIRFYKVFEWLMLIYSKDDAFTDFVATRMRN